MSIVLKLVLGTVAAVPLVVTLAMLGWFVYLIRTDDWRIIEYASTNPLSIAIFNLALIVAIYGPNIYYIIHAGINRELRDRRVVWILLMIFLGVLAMPIYWFTFIWRDNYYEGS